MSGFHQLCHIYDNGQYSGHGIRGGTGDKRLGNKETSRINETSEKYNDLNADTGPDFNHIAIEHYATQCVWVPHSLSELYVRTMDSLGNFFKVHSIEEI